jgi:hypothetical protein
MAIENLKKHVGQLNNTGVRVAVVFRKLPNDENNCLIVETERIPDSYHDYLIQCANSKEAAETNDFFEVLNRRTFPDGSNCLHQRGFLRKEPVSNITMIPLPGQMVPLGLINATIDKKVDEYTAQQTTASVPASVEPAAVVDTAAVAKGLLLQAELLEKDAAAKREEAYTLDASSRPGKGRPALPVDIKAQKLEEGKIKRRERDRAKAKAVKEEKASAAVSDRLAAKLKRDAARVS